MSAIEPAPMTSPSTRPTLTPLLLILLALLSSFTPLSIDMYLPALPVIAVDLSGTVGDIQLTLSAFMIAFGFGQIFYGPAGGHPGRHRDLCRGEHRLRLRRRGRPSGAAALPAGPVGVRRRGAGPHHG